MGASKGEGVAGPAGDDTTTGQDNPGRIRDFLRIDVVNIVGKPQVYCLNEFVGIVLGSFGLAACARCVGVSAVAKFAKILLQLRAIRVNTPWLANRFSMMSSSNRFESEHTAVEVDGDEIVLGCKSEILRIFPIQALAWPLDGDPCSVWSCRCNHFCD